MSFLRNFFENKIRSHICATSISFVVMFCGAISQALPVVPVGYSRYGDDVCPDQNTTDESSLAGFDPRNPKAITKDQDTILNCKETAASTFLCASLKSKKFFDPSANHSAQGKDLQAFADRGCSSLDLMVVMFDRQRRLGNPNCQTMKDFNRIVPPPKPGETREEAKRREALDCFSGNVGDVLAAAQESGMCPESYFPSEFTKRQAGESSSLADEDNHKELLRVLESIQKKSTTEANVGEIGFCPGCAAEALVGGDPTKVAAAKDIVNKALKDNSISDFEILLKINKLACPDSMRNNVANELKKMKFTSIGALPGDKFQLNKVFQDNKLAILNIRPSILRPDQPASANGLKDDLDHYVVAYAPTRAQLPNLDHYSPNYKKMVNKCSVVVNSSWGQGCFAHRDKATALIDNANRTDSALPNNSMILDSDGTQSMTCQEDTGSYVLSQEVLSTTGTVLWYLDTGHE